MLIEKREKKRNPFGGPALTANAAKKTTATPQN